MPRRSARHCGAGRGLGLVAALSLSCGGAATIGSKPAPSASGISPPPRSLQVEPDTVVLKGRWVPIEAVTDSPELPNAVQVVCLRTQRSCKEDLNRLTARAGAAPVHEVLEYRIEDWTKWGTPAGRLVASRRDEGAVIEIRVSLSGLAAEKAVVRKGSETRWRLE